MILYTFYIYTHICMCVCIYMYLYVYNLQKYFKCILIRDPIKNHEGCFRVSYAIYEYNTEIEVAT